MSFGESIPTRVLVLALVACVLAFGGLVYVPPLLRPGVPVWNYPQLPPAVAGDLTRRGCNVVRGDGVVSAELSASGKLDWAVLCQQGEQASLLVYLNGKAPATVFNTHGSGLLGEGENSRGIRAADWSYVLAHNPGLAQLSGPPACIEDGVGMGSTIYCFRNGGWVGLTGAD